MRQSGRAVALTLKEVEAALRPGLTTAAIDALAAQTLHKLGARSPFLHYPNSLMPEKPFPASVCISVNDELVHGVPSDAVVLEDGDIVTVDCGAEIDGWLADGAWTFTVGTIDPETQRLLDVTRQALYDCILAARVGHRTGDISAVIQTTVERQGYRVAQQFTCHGVGRSLHEAPFFFNHGKAGSGVQLRPGMTLALEPMVFSGSNAVVIDEDDGWTVFSEDGGVTAHFEHTIAITEGEPIILTVE